MDLKHHATKTLFRSLRLMDVPGVLQHLKFQDLRHCYYDLFWNRVALELGATIRKWDNRFHRLARQGSIIIVRGPEVRLDDHLTLDLMGNKALTYELMLEQGLRVPRHVRFDVTDQVMARALLEGIKRPLVVKPNGGTGGGRGVTTGITDTGALRRAALWAARFDTSLIAEEQLEGHSYRLLFLDGKFIDAIRRDPPRIVGDGRHSIKQLVADENRRRLEGRPFVALSPLKLDRDAISYLDAQDLHVRSVPAAGETIVVKRAVNENASDGNHVVRDDVHPVTIETCARLVTNLGVRLAGIDIIARDIAKPLTRTNGMIGEINTTPGLHHHDLTTVPRQGLSIAAEILGQMFDTESGTMMVPTPVKAPPVLKVVSG